MCKRTNRNPILFIFIISIFATWAQVSAAPRQAPTAVFTVNTNSDLSDNNPGDGVCQTGPGGLFCSLRAAIEEANALPGHDTIQFNLGGNATMTFSPDPEFPEIIDPLTIDAITGVGTCPTETDPADLKILITGFETNLNASSLNRGITLAPGSDGSRIEGLEIGYFGTNVTPGHGIEIQSSDNTIRCNHIGATPAGLGTFGNTIGIYITGSNNVIGGNAVQDRNVISSNDDQGIFIANGVGNEIYHNYIGVDPDGQPLGNGAEGILLTDGSETRMGDDGKGNVIAHNGRTGIFNSLTSLAPLVIGNSIHNNGYLGFDRITTASLFPGVTPNDSAHPFYFFPTLTGAFPSGIITGTYDNFIDADKNFYVHFYSNSNCDASGHGEGKTYLGFTALTTDNNGFFSFNVNFGSLTPGDQITATASKLADDLSGFEGGTSEFSACITVTDSTYIIDTTSNFADSNPGDGVCDVIGPNTFCSLRAAIEEVNTQTGGPFLLQFDLGIGGGTIQPNAPLPAITTPVVIDGTTAQLGANCASTNTPTTLLVVLDGSNLSSGSGLVFDNGSIDSTIQGITIINFPDHGVELNSNRNHIRCSYIGLQADGIIAGSNDADGVYITGDNNIVGGPLPADQNVISGNGGSGVFIENASDNTLKGNLIGLAAGGLLAVPNGGSGVRLNDAHNNQIGGTSASEGNIISGNGTYGINLHSGSSNNVIESNYIGTSSTGVTDVGNASAGIRLDASPDNWIGGISSELGNVIAGNNGNGVLITNLSNDTLVQHNQIGVNVNGSSLPNDLNGVRINNSNRNSLVDNWIAYNTGDGVNVTDTAQRNELSRNSIHDNGLMGIDLDDDDVANINDWGDSDSGGNDLQNYPVINVASIETGVIEGQLFALASTVFQLDFYRSDSCDVSGFGEGEVYLGTAGFISDNSNEFTVNNITGFGWGDYLTATATDNINNTSEFSSCFQCHEPLLMSLNILNNGGNIELLMIGNHHEDEFLIYRSINDPYFTPSTSYDQIVGNLWADGDNDELGNVAENHYYLVRGQNGCGYGSDSKRVGEFDFEIVPGS